MNIKIKSIKEEYKMKISVNYTVKDLKDQLRTHYGYSNKEQKLYFEKTLLNDEDLLSKYNVKEGSIIDFHFQFNDFKLIVQVPSGVSHKINVNKNDKISKLKDKIKSLEHIPINEQILLFRGQPVDDNKTLSDLDITDTSLLSLIPKLQKSDKQVLIRLDSKEMCTLPISNETKVSDLKETLYRDYEINDTNVNLIYKNTLLSNNMNMGALGIDNALTSLVVTGITPLTCKLIINLVNGKNVEVQVFANYDLVNLTSSVEAKIGSKLNNHLFLFNGEAIESRKPLSFFGISSGSIIDLIPKDKGPIDITINAANNKTCNIKIYKKQKVKDLKLKIQQKFAIKPEEQVLSFNEFTFEDDKFISDYFIERFSVVTVLYRLYGGNWLL